MESSMLALIAEYFDTKCFIALLLACAMAFLARVLASNKCYKNLPPGPTGLPLVGSLFSMGLHAHETLNIWAKYYGNVMTVKLGSSNMIVLSGLDEVNETLVKHGDIFSDRPQRFTGIYLSGNKGNTSYTTRICCCQEMFLEYFYCENGFGTMQECFKTLLNIFRKHSRVSVPFLQC